MTSDTYRPIKHQLESVSPDEVVRRLRRDLEVAATRRSVRHFSREPVPRAAIELALQIAATAPSGAHRQPWHFVAISEPDLKARIRAAAEIEEREFYERRAPRDWLDALAPLGTDFVKTHLTDAPWLIVVFRRDAELLPNGERAKNYYVSESVGIAVGFLIQALHRAGLATLPHTPAPMKFLRELCDRPPEEKPYVLLPVGYPHAECLVPDLRRRAFDEVVSFW